MSRAYEIIGSEVRPVVGELILNVHAAEACLGQWCTVHRPSEHPMRSMRLLWRADRGMFERICRHGIGHPDPDQIRFWRRTSEPEEAAAQALHGCCGICCWSPPIDPRDPRGDGLCPQCPTELTITAERSHCIECGWKSAS